jgi:hypothetical protein
MQNPRNLATGEADGVVAGMLIVKEAGKSLTCNMAPLSTPPPYDGYCIASSSVGTLFLVLLYPGVNTGRPAR